MRTAEEIQEDIASASRAYEAMSNVDGAESEGKGIFLDNCARRIRELQKELRDRRETMWDKIKNNA